MQYYTVTEAKAKFSEVIARAMAGEEIIVTKQGVPTVRLAPVEPRARKPLMGLYAGQMKVPDDFDVWPDDIADSFTKDN